MMIARISNLLVRVSTNRVTLAGLLIFVLFTAFVLPKQASQGKQADQQAGTPDLSLYYTSAELYRIAESYGEAGRGDYLRVRFTFDLFWPLVYTFFLATTLSWLFSRAFPPSSAWLYANLAPLVAMILDFAENIFTSIIMLRYPQPTPIIAELAGFLTFAKWIFVTLSFVLLVVGSIAILSHRRKIARD